MNRLATAVPEAMTPDVLRGWRHRSLLEDVTYEQVLQHEEEEPQCLHR